MNNPLTDHNQGQCSLTPTDDRPPARSPAAERMRRYRERRRNGLRSFTIVLRESEINALVHFGWLAPESRLDRDAVISALYDFLDRTFAGKR